MRFGLTAFFAAIFSLFGLAQAPQLINYQGIARDMTGEVIQNTNVAIKFEILQGSASGPVIFTDDQSSLALTTNSLGLFTTQIGINGILNANAWPAGPYFLKVWADFNLADGITLVAVGAQELASVPFALRSNHALTVPSSYTNDILTIGGASYNMPSNVSITQGPGTMVNITGGPNYTISSIVPQLTLTPNGASITIVGAGSPVGLPSAPIPTITPLGMVGLTNTTPPSNSYTIDVPVPQYNPSTGVLAFGTGTNTAFVTPTLMLTGNTLRSGPVSNTVALPAAVTVTGSGIAAVSGSQNYTVNVPASALALTGNTLSIVGSNNVILPSNPPVSLIPTGIASITAVGTNTFNVGVPAPAYNGTALVIGASTTTIAPTLALTNNTLITVGPPSNSISLSGIFPWKQGTGSISLTTSSDFVSVGSPGAPSAKLDVYGAFSSGSIIRAENANASNVSPVVDIYTNGGDALKISNTSASGTAGTFNSQGIALLTQNTGALPTFQATNLNASASAVAGNFIGGLLTQSKTGAGSFAFRAQSSAPIVDLFVVRNDGNVGVGTNAPASRLDVVQNLASVHTARFQNQNVSGSSSAEFVDNGGTSRMTMGYANASFPVAWAGSSYINSASTDLIFATATTERMRITSTGNVGFGATPTSKFHVELTNGRFRLHSLAASGNIILLGEFTGSGSNAPQLRWTTPSVAGFMDIGQNPNGDFVVEGSDVPRMVVQNTGAVGIGTSSPTRTLDVVGNVKFTDGSQGNGKVLGSDASGNAAWRNSPPATSYVGLNNSSTNVGTSATAIGTGSITFNKQYATTEMEITAYTNAYGGSFQNGATNIYFEIYVDGVPGSATTKHYMFSSVATEYISLKSFFSGLSAGTHTVTIVGVAAGSVTASSTGVLLDPGGYSGTVLMKEIF
jgi:hypothetical protein